MFCRCVSRVATIKGASGFSSLSPVEIPTRQFLDFHCAYLSFARARVGTVYVALPPYCEKKSSNTNVFPVPVGACKTTSRPAFMCATASACQKSGIRKAVPNSSISRPPATRSCKRSLQSRRTSCGSWSRHTIYPKDLCPQTSSRPSFANTPCGTRIRALPLQKTLRRFRQALA